MLDRHLTHRLSRLSRTHAPKATVPLLGPPLRKGQLLHVFLILVPRSLSMNTKRSGTARRKGAKLIIYHVRNLKMVTPFKPLRRPISRDKTIKTAHPYTDLISRLLRQSQPQLLNHDGGCPSNYRCFYHFRMHVSKMARTKNRPISAEHSLCLNSKIPRKRAWVRRCQPGSRSASCSLMILLVERPPPSIKNRQNRPSREEQLLSC